MLQTVFDFLRAHTGWTAIGNECLLHDRCVICSPWIFISPASLPVFPVVVTLPVDTGGCSEGAFMLSTGPPLDTCY